MDLGELVGKNAAAIIAVIGTVSGALVVSVSNWLQRKAEWTNQRKLRQLERSIDFEERYLIRPIVEYLETELQVLQRVYSKGFEKEGTIPAEMYQEHHWKMLLTEARVKVYGDEQLIDKFGDFTRKRISIGTSIFDSRNKDVNLAFRDLEEAEGLAAEILATLKNKLSEIQG